MIAALLLSAVLVQAAPPAGDKPSAPPAPSLSVSGTFVPAQPSGPDPFLFLLQLDSTAPLHGAVAEVSSPLGFSIPQPRQEVAEGARKATLSFRVVPDGDSPRAGTLVATVTAGRDRTPLNQSHYVFSYTPHLVLLAFYLVGLLGVLLGWASKLVVKAHAGKTPPPIVTGLFLSPREAAANAQAMASGRGPVHGSRFAVWLSSSAPAYYAVDLLLTLVIAFLALVALSREGHAPDAASTWQGAMILGFGLGLLTPSDLLGKVK